MTIVQNLKDILPDLTKTERKAAEYMIKNPIDVVRYGSSESIAGLSGSSRAGIIRLAKKLGFNGFSDFKYQLAKEMNNPAQADGSSISSYYINSIQELQKIEEHPEFSKAVEYIKNAKHIYVYGKSHSDYSAHQFEFRMIRNGFATTKIDTALSVSEYANFITEQDALVIFSISGNLGTTSNEQIRNLKSTKNCKVITITMTPHTLAHRFSDVTIELPCVSRTTNEIILDDAPIFFISIELLINALNKD